MRATRTVIPGVLAVSFFVLAIGAFHANPKGSSTFISVTSTVHNSVGDSSSGTDYFTQGDNTNVNPATYTSGNGVISQIADQTSYGDWDLFLINSVPVRYLHLTFSPANGSPASPVPDGIYSPKVISRCYDGNNNVTGFIDIAPGMSNNLCSLRITLDFESTSYIFVMSPDPLNTPGTSTGSTTVTCNTTSGTTCNSWTIVPYAAGAKGTVAALYRVGKGGKQTLVGTYNNTYRIDVTTATH
jgi:hypothetical protein